MSPDVDHPAPGLVPGGWWACDQPERPVEVGLTAFDLQCDKCLVLMDVARRAHGDGNHPVTTMDAAGRPSSITTVDRILADRRPDPARMFTDRYHPDRRDTP